jgi:hypothetical protein
MKKYLLISIVLVLVIAMIFYGAKLFSPGSYAEAEKFELPMNEADLINIITNFKNENPEFKIPDQIKLADGKNNPQDHWYHVYFYYPQENQVVYAWVRSSGKQSSTIAFVGVNNGLELGHWKYINKDLSSSENEAQIEKFQNRILNKLKRR